MPLIKTYVVPHPPIIVPEIGRGDEQKIQKTLDAYQTISEEIAQLKPDTIIISSPHATTYADYFHISPGASANGTFSSFGANHIRFNVDYDRVLVSRISAAMQEAGIAGGSYGERNPELDHGVMVPLYFINQTYQDYKLIRLSLSGFPLITHYQLGEVIQKVLDETQKKVIWVASGDLSHKLKSSGPYGFNKAGPIFDAQLVEALKKADFKALLTMDAAMIQKAAECGLRSFVMMAGALDCKKVKPTFYAYEGPFGVGYATLAYCIEGDDKTRNFRQQTRDEETKNIQTIRNQEDAIVKLARHALETFVKTQKIITVPNPVPDDLIAQRKGAFVSLKLHGELRGCIGTSEPTKKHLAAEIIDNAISAGTNDGRFDPVTEDELPWLVYSVDVLSQPEPIDTIEALDVNRYGVIVRCGKQSGLLLPNISSIETPEEQVSIALQKAGIKEHEAYNLQRFEVKRYH